MYSGKIAVPPGGGGIGENIMIQVYKEAFKARATSLRARRVAECF
jgi:hypothetical protein